MLDLPPPGFQGFDPHKPVEIYRRHLPHWRQAGATYFVTFRLADALPRERVVQLKEERELWERSHPAPTDPELEAMWREQMTKIEQWTDQGHGACLLSCHGAAEIVEGTLMHFDGARYALFGRIVMPNHVHVVLRPFDGHALEDTIESWKKFSARQINALCGRSGPVWQEEYFDRIVRDTPHLRRVVRYLEKNAQQTGWRRKVWIAPMWLEWVGRGRDDASGEASP
jgi:putative transposase